MNNIFTELKNFNPPPETDIEYISMFSGKNHPRWGKPCSEETKAAIGNANRGRVHTDQSRRNMSESHLGKPNPKSGASRLGKPLTEECKKNKSEAMKRYWKKKKEQDPTFSLKKRCSK